MVYHITSEGQDQNESTPGPLDSLDHHSTTSGIGTSDCQALASIDGSIWMDGLRLCSVAPPKMFNGLTAQQAMTVLALTTFQGHTNCLHPLSDLSDSFKRNTKLPT